MDPFVSRIGDVTIQRVPSQNNTPGEKKDEPPSDGNLSPMEDLPASSKDEPSENETLKSPKDASPDQNSKAEKSSDEAEDESKIKREQIKPEEATEAAGGTENLGSLDEDQKFSEDPHSVGEIKSEANEKASDEAGGEELEGEQAAHDPVADNNGDDDEDDVGEGAMDASQFLEMAQAENEDEDGLFDKTGETGIKEESQENEDDSENEPIRKKKRSNLSPSDVKQEAPEQEEDMDQNFNGAMEEGDYAAGESGEDYEEGDDLADGNYEDADERIDESGVKTSKSDLEDAADKKAEGDGEGDEKKDDVKKKLRSRQKRKVLVEDDTDESEEERKKKRKKRKKKGEGDETSEDTESEDDGSGKKKKKKKKKKPAKKNKKKDDDDDGSGGEKEKKSSNMRRNIRDVMDETQLDEATLAAQRQEMERLRRVQEQQRVLREMAIQRQHQQRADRVMSLLSGKTSILKQVSVSPAQSSKGSTSSSSSPNTVVVKVGSGSAAQANKKVLELLKVPKDGSEDVKPSLSKTLISKPIQGTTMMTPSVSIAPVRPGAAGQRPTSSTKPPSFIQAQASYSASEGEEDEEEEILEDGEVEGELEEGEIDEEGKKKKKDVVTISSSSSSEDDCIVLSEPSDDGEEEEGEDPTNSGMHTNDAYNVPDEEGRVQVNMGKPEGDPDIFLAPHIARLIKPHQIGGIRFLYDNVVESIERFNTSTGFGCILAHSMGLGKTLQVITFCDIFLRHTPAKTVMCIMPINTLQNWLSEFNMWMPDDPSATPLALQGEVRPRTFGIYVLNDSHKTLKARAKVVDEWTTNGGVLLIGYEMYRQLSLKKLSKPKKSRRKRPVSDDEEVDPEEEEKRQKEMLEKVFEALVKPGPDLVICDEGHRIKNSHASISLALKQIRSKRRVVLTGYPLQNNLLEYWCMVDFVRPNYLGSKTEFCNMFERPIMNGQCIDSTPQDIRLMRYRAHVLHSLLEGFVQRRSHSVLTNALPQKEEYVLLVRLTPFQRKLYDTFMNEVVRTKAVPNPLKAFAVCCKIWNHPDVLYQFLKKREGGEGVDLDLEEAAAALAANTVTDPTGTPIEERKAAPKGRPRGSKGRKKKDASPSKPAATVLPNTSQSDHNNPYNLSAQYPMHGQINSNSSLMGSYNPYSGSGQSPYGSFNAPHHYNPSSSYGHAGYSGSSGPFNAGSSSLGLNASGQGSFSGSASSGYGDSLASSPASQSSQYGSSSSQSMFSGSSSNNPSSSSTPGYGSMGPPPYFSGNSSSGQHSMADGFSSSSNYNQSWSGNSSYNSFSQGPSGSQSFPGSSYSGSGQTPPFAHQGYAAGGSSSSFNQSMYGSGSASSSTSSTQQYQSGLMDQQMLDPNLMAPPSRPNLNPNLIPQQSPVNASGMLPGGAPTKNPAMIPSGMMGSGMGMGNTASGMSGMNENMMGHHPQNMGMSSSVYQNPNMMNLSGNPTNQPQTGPMALSGMSSTDAPSAEDLLHSSDDFRAFDASLSKVEPGRGMYDVKDRNMFDPWGNSHGHPQNYDMLNSQDMKPLQNSGMKKSENNKFSPGPSPLDQLKNELGDVKLDEKPNVKDDELSLNSKSGPSSQTEQDTKASDDTESWRVDSMEIVDKDKEGQDDGKDKEGKEDEEEGVLGADGKPPVDASAAIIKSGKEDPGIPYDWAVELMKDYVPGLIENSAKMVLFFCILEEALALGDRILLFSQSLFTLSLIEEYLQRSFIPVPGVYERWQRNRTYFRLDGSTAALEREKLINEFNANPNVYLFLVSTRAGSLGINLVGANRVIVFDASWNPCHDTQAVCRVYRYGQKKPCFVYRFVMDNCLEKKIYDRQINKQGMSDRVVDECNPDAHLSIKEVTNLCWDEEKESEIKDLSSEKDKYTDTAMQKIVEKHGKLLTKAPFQHESLLVDRKDKKLSQAEKRLAKRSYEMEKRANNKPVYNYYNNQGGLQIRPVQRDAAGNIIKPVASVRPIQSEMNSALGTGTRNTKWIPAEVWQRQGMSAQEMTLPLDVVIPTNSPERSSIVLKAGQRVMVLKSPKGIYMQLENGKIIAIRTAFKTALAGNNKTDGNKPFGADKDDLKKGVNVSVMNKGNVKLTSGIHPLRNNPNITITPRVAPGAIRSGIRPILNRVPGGRMQTTANMRPWVRPGGVAGRAVPIRPGQNIRPGIRGLNPSVTVTPAAGKTRTLGPVTITPRLAPATNFPGLKNLDKDRAKTEPKSDGKVERNERIDSEDGQSSNSSMDSSSKRNDPVLPKVDEKVVKPLNKEDLQEGDHDSSFGKSAASNLTKNLNDGALENKSSDGFSDKQGSSRSQDHMLNKAPDMSSTSTNATAFSGKTFNADKGSSQSSSFPGNFPSSSSSSGSKQYSSNMHGGSMMTQSNFNKPTDLSIEDKSSANGSQWKSPPAPQAFSPGVPAASSKSVSQQRSLESPAYDDNSNNSVHSNISSKSSTAHGSNLESRAVPPVEGGLSSYVGTDLSTSHSKTSNKLSSSSVTSSQSSSSTSKLNPSSSSSSVPTTTATNFPPLDPYANIYGGYGAYPGGLPTSNYYNPYSYPAGFLPDPKATISNRSSTEPTQNTSVPSSRSSSKSSTSRSESKKSSHESSRSSLPAAYESRQPSSSSSSGTVRSSSSSASAASAAGSSTAVPDAGAYSSSSSAAAAAAAAYNPMMMSPSFNPTSSQYPPPSSAAGPANPFTAAAAAAANYTNPYAASPYGYPPNQFDAMYSAFHRPEGGLDPTSPYLRPMAGAAPPAAGFYPQYGGQYGSARDPYGQIPPYPGSPFIMPPAPYGGLASSATSASSTATSDQSPSQ